MNEEVISPVKESLLRMQKFDIDSLGREDLGHEMEFTEIKPSAQRLINLYKRIPEDILIDLNTPMLNSLKSRSDSDYNLLDQIVKFSIKNTQNPVAQRNSLIQQVDGVYNDCFALLSPYISYGFATITDVSIFEANARATLQSIDDSIKKEKDDLEKIKINAESILDEIKRVAAEQGVTQQAIYFKEESDSHDKAVDGWYRKIIIVASVCLVCSVLSFFIHKIPWIAPTNSYESIQLVSSKVIFFGVLAYILVLFSKTYLSHRHNAVVNKHRQNALLTYRSLVDASKDRATEDIILVHAAACIFSPQDTGYAINSQDPSSKSVLELLTKTCASSDRLPK